MSEKSEFSLKLKTKPDKKDGIDIISNFKIHGREDEIVTALIQEINTNPVLERIFMLAFLNRF